MWPQVSHSVLSFLTCYRSLDYNRQAIFGPAMQSSLIPERPLIISPTLAATIGLEEAVMLHVLSELLAHRPSAERKGLQWVKLGQQDLLDALPFWAWIDIRRVQKNLQDIGLILVDGGSSEHNDWLFAINQRADAVDKLQPDKQPVPPSATGNAVYIAQDWQPGEEWLSMCRQHGIADAFAQSLVPGFVLYWRDRAQSRFSWGNAFYKHVLREWRQEQTRRGASELETPMSAQWQPSGEAIDILCNAGVSEAFIEDAVPEFVLYWRERGAQNGAWNTRFIEHIRRQWARYKASVEHDGLPKPISENWQPSKEVFEVLRLAEIDESFACDKIPEFVLYWRDTGHAQASWNTKFLQFIKYSWARRLDAGPGTATGTPHARNQQSVEQGGQGLEATFRRFTDRSWAE